jgi:formylmethanofuran dehydrogenase subunit D
MSKNKLDIQTITTVEQADIDKLDEQYFDKANFIIVVPEDMTKTY